MYFVAKPKPTHMHQKYGLEVRLINFAARIIDVAEALPKKKRDFTCAALWRSAGGRKPQRFCSQNESLPEGVAGNLQLPQVN